MKYYSILIPIIVLCTACSGSKHSNRSKSDIPTAKVDGFKYKDYSVEVYFQDPLEGLIKKERRFNKYPPRKKADLLDQYLHNNSVYRFILFDGQNENVGELILRGNPKVTNSAAFYQVVEKSTSTGKVNSHRIGVRGSLFEHMSPFQTKRGKKAIGNGIQFFRGIFMRVTPYSEVKSAVKKHFQHILPK